MNVSVNGNAVQLDDGATVGDAVALLTEERRGVAVSVDREVVPRSMWDETNLHEGARVEVLAAASGG